jgi:hypothetical protein
MGQEGHGFVGRMFLRLRQRQVHPEWLIWPHSGKFQESRYLLSLISARYIPAQQPYLDEEIILHHKHHKRAQFCLLNPATRSITVSAGESPAASFIDVCDVVGGGITRKPDILHPWTAWNSYTPQILTIPITFERSSLF